jgi:hypothetical protein
MVGRSPTRKIPNVISPIIATVCLARIVEAADVLVRHLAREPQLVVQPREAAVTGPFAVRAELGQELQGDGLIEGEVVGAEDFAHAAAAEQRDEPVAGLRRLIPARRDGRVSTAAVPVWSPATPPGAASARS